MIGGFIVPGPASQRVIVRAIGPSLNLPANDLESAIVATLPANGASYTAIVRGVNGTTGVAVVEVYGLP